MDSLQLSCTAADLFWLENGIIQTGNRRLSGPDQWVIQTSVKMTRWNMTKCLSLWSYVALNYKCCIFLTRLSPVGLEGVAHKSLISKEGTQRHIFFPFFPPGCHWWWRWAELTLWAAIWLVRCVSATVGHIKSQLLLSWPIMEKKQFKDTSDGNSDLIYKY